MVLVPAWAWPRGQFAARVHDAAAVAGGEVGLVEVVALVDGAALLHALAGGRVGCSRRGASRLGASRFGGSRLGISRWGASRLGG